jgi:hypothetical protein
MLSSLSKDSFNLCSVIKEKSLTLLSWEQRQVAEPPSSLDVFIGDAQQVFKK